MFWKGCSFIPLSLSPYRSLILFMLSQSSRHSWEFLFLFFSFVHSIFSQTGFLAPLWQAVLFPPWFLGTTPDRFQVAVLNMGSSFQTFSSPEAERMNSPPSTPLILACLTSELQVELKSCFLNALLRSRAEILGADQLRLCAAFV